MICFEMAHNAYIKQLDELSCSKIYQNSKLKLASHIDNRLPLFFCKSRQEKNCKRERIQMLICLKMENNQALE